MSTEPRRLARFAPLAVVAVGLAAAFAFGWVDYLSLDQLRERREALTAFVDARPLASLAAFTALYCLIVALSIPGASIMTLSGGFLFGALLGTLATVVGATAGAILIFLAARSAFGDVLRRRAGPAVARFEEGVRENAFSYVLTLRLLPVVPFWLANIGLALVNVPLRTFVLGTLLGVIPGTFVYSALGSSLGTLFERNETPNLGLIFEPQFLLPLLGLAALALAPALIRKLRKRP